MLRVVPETGLVIFVRDGQLGFIDRFVATVCSPATKSNIAAPAPVLA